MGGQVIDRWVQAHNQPVPLELLDVEDGVAGGQIQSVAADHVREALHRFRQMQPTEPIDVILWNAPSAERGLPPKLYRAPTSLFLSSLRRQERGPELANIRWLPGGSYSKSI